MSDHFQAVVFRGELTAQAGRLSNRILDYLVGAGIIVDEPSDCTLGDPTKSFAPGMNFQDVIAEKDELLCSLRTNGVEFSEGRLVEMALELYEAICTSCNHRGEVGDDFFEAISQWYGGDDYAPFVCPNCGHSQRLLDWKIEPPCGFGSVVVKFWNWGPLSAGFLAQLARLAGAEFVVVNGSI